jgi:hypothetical protein
MGHEVQQGSLSEEQRTKRPREVKYRVSGFDRVAVLVNDRDSRKRELHGFKDGERHRDAAHDAGLAGDHFGFGTLIDGNSRLAGHVGSKAKVLIERDIHQALELR